ncbi:uncharacterized protein LAESUDRAFT_710419 [Laetiporus sulphureus 93-53]|uniref:Uncharacterized protein n=1 Tax=Laetiporus sulphureus 93-53 TaxID=1314785 RepID=A0A165HL99_9APHY|nr:uncharacterized protein LAESUDRAFT_710419 [Laetiporus sulphureus 93-53]KZT11878.1 hypothetical protein LAESUDRAFT_710419 [Laetiporus sulphureus 93-53]
MSTIPRNGQSLIDHRQLLLEAAAQFSAWVQTQAPGAVVMLCGGLALSQYGNARTTLDADYVWTCVGLVAQDARLVVGPKIYWKHQPSGMYVQVDFVDAHLFWAPFDVEQMVDRSLPLPSLNLPTLLVGKLKCALERNQADVRERRMKQANDLCLATIKEFGRLRRDVLAPSGMDLQATSWIVNWRQLVVVVVSRLSEEFVNVATSA